MQIKFLKSFSLLAFIFFFSINMLGQTKLNYPNAKKVQQVDDYHGIKVFDPYRWLENPKSDDSKAWIKAQNKLTNYYLNAIPQRKKIKQRITKLWNYEKYSTPISQGDQYFYFKNNGLQNQSVFYVADSLNSAGKVLLDPNKFSKDGTTSLGGMAISNDGKMIAYGISKAGSDWREYRFRNIETGKEFPDILEHIKFSGLSWTKKDRGVYYSRYARPNEETKLKDTNSKRKLYYHKLGTKQSEDKLIYESHKDKTIDTDGFVTDDGNWLIIYQSKVAWEDIKIYYKDLRKPNSRILPLVDKLESNYSYVSNIGSKFYFHTNKDAPLGRILSVNLRDKNKTWNEVIPQAKENLESVSMLNNHFVLNYVKDAYTQIKIYNKRGNFVRDVKLPGIGTVWGFNGKRLDKETFYTYSSFNSPPTTYRYNMKTGKSTVYRKPNVDFKPNNYEVKQVFYSSKDGTKIPMFIVHKKGIKMNGKNPTLLYGYGGFNYSLTPDFSASRILWLEKGGIYAVANLRGGGEYGKKWHQAGIKLKKQNVFDDFIAASEYLIKENYTNSKKLAIQGGSNGGLLVGAVLNQRPDLFGAALPAIGVMDMLRFHKFTIGRFWISDYGSPENAAEFKALYAYSPLHNIKKGTKYPAVLVTTSDHDDRVVPAHSFKYAATLQEAQAGNAPILIRIETNAGHGSGKPTSKRIQVIADIYSFLFENLEMN